MLTVMDFIIPPDIASTARNALSKAGSFIIDKETLDTAHILAYDGSIDVKEVAHQLIFFKLDAECGRLHEEAPKDSVAHVIWRLRGGVRARKWLNKLKIELEGT